MKNYFINLPIVLLWTILGIVTGQNTYTGELTFDYSGSLNGEFQSGVVIDSLDGVPANGAFATVSGSDSSYSTFITAIAPADNETVDIFLVHINTENFPTPGIYNVDGLDLEGLEGIPTTMLFIPDADTAMLSGFFDTFMDGIEDSLNTNELIMTMLLELAQTAFLPLSGEIAIDVVNDTSLTGGFSGEFMKLVFPPQFMSVEEGYFSLSGFAVPEVLAPPENLALEWTGNEIELSWEYGDSLLIDGFNIYRGLDENALEWNVSVSPEMTQYLDDTIITGESYTYAITAFTALGLESSLSDPGSISIPSSFPGDVNEDEMINVNDILLVVNHILEIYPLTDQQQLLGDLNSDGNISVIDIVIMVEIILGNG